MRFGLIFLGISTTAIAAACGGKVAFDGLPSGGTGGHGGQVSTTVTTTTTTTTTTTSGFGGTTGDVNPVTTAVTNVVAVGAGGGSGGCASSCAERLTDPCPDFCSQPSQTVLDALSALLNCASINCATECDNGMGVLKCGDATCGACIQQFCPMQATNCFNN